MRGLQSRDCDFTLRVRTASATARSAKATVAHACGELSSVSALVPTPEAEFQTSYEQST
jgi:hypothetical protein